MRLLLPLIVLLPGCDYGASTKTLEDTAVENEDRNLDGGTTTDTDPGDDGGGDSGGDDGDGGDGPGGDDTEAPASDLDGDGWSEEDGDCDDGDARVHPEAIDDCDNWDEDCDGRVDEDAWADDIWEPNDSASEAVSLGSLTDGSVYTVSGYLHTDDDADRFELGLDDNNYTFTMYFDLTGIPDGSIYLLSLIRTNGGDVVEIGSIENKPGEQISAVYEDVLGDDQSGDYQVIITTETPADCSRSYELAVGLDESWW